MSYVDHFLLLSYSSTQAHYTPNIAAGASLRHYDAALLPQRFLGAASFNLG